MVNRCLKLSASANNASSLYGDIIEPAVLLYNGARLRHRIVYLRIAFGNTQLRQLRAARSAILVAICLIPDLVTA